MEINNKIEVVMTTDFDKFMKPRRSAILDQINAKGLGLEIGPYHAPCFPKKEGFNVKSMDFQGRDELLKRASSDCNISADGIARIEEVDYIWSGGKYLDLVGDERFDWIVASHVVEHTPDLIGFLNNCADVLTDDGILALIVPDKRYTFDRLRQQSSIGSIIDAHIQSRTRPTPGDILDLVLMGSDIKRDEHFKKTVTLHNNPAADMYNECTAKASYTDSHVWVFGPSNFRLVAEDIYHLGLTPLRELSFKVLNPGEFFIFLSKNGKGPTVDRITLAKQSITENHKPLSLCKCGKLKNSLEKRIYKYAPAFMRETLLRLTDKLGARPY